MLSGVQLDPDFKPRSRSCEASVAYAEGSREPLVAVQAGCALLCQPTSEVRHLSHLADTWCDMMMCSSTMTASLSCVTSYDLHTSTGSWRCAQVQAGASPSPAPQLSPLNRYQVPKTSKLPQTQADLAVYVRALCRPPGPAVSSPGRFALTTCRLFPAD